MNCQTIEIFEPCLLDSVVNVLDISFDFGFYFGGGEAEDLFIIVIVIEGIFTVFQVGSVFDAELCHKLGEVGFAIFGVLVEHLLAEIVGAVKFAVLQSHKGSFEQRVGVGACAAVSDDGLLDHGGGRSGLGFFGLVVEDDGAVKHAVGDLHGGVDALVAVEEFTDYAICRHGVEAFLYTVFDAVLFILMGDACVVVAECGGGSLKILILDIGDLALEGVASRVTGVCA